MIESWNKLVGIIVVGVAAVVLGREHILDGQAVIALLSAILGYVFGNGHGIISAKRAVGSGNK
jgi:ABC-type uncharacterized transport system permease subunit